jgi:hypothetical protein
MGLSRRGARVVSGAVTVTLLLSATSGANTETPLQKWGDSVGPALVRVQASLNAAVLVPDPYKPYNPALATACQAVRVSVIKLLFAPAPPGYSAQWPGVQRALSTLANTCGQAHETPAIDYSVIEAAYEWGTFAKYLADRHVPVGKDLVQLWQLLVYALTHRPQAI